VTKKEPDWPAYNRELSRNAEFFRAEIESSSKGAFEYGTMLVRNLLYLNGGALVVLPAISSILPDELKNNVFTAASAFVVGLCLAVVCGYFAHLNWLLLSFPASRNAIEERRKLIMPILVKNIKAKLKFCSIEKRDLLIDAQFG
jgi:hypothetical protein